MQHDVSYNRTKRLPNVFRLTPTKNAVARKSLVTTSPLLLFVAPFTVYLGALYLLPLSIPSPRCCPLLASPLLTLLSSAALSSLTSFSLFLYVTSSLLFRTVTVLLEPSSSVCIVVEKDKQGCLSSFVTRVDLCLIHTSIILALASGWSPFQSQTFLLYPTQPPKFSGASK